MNSRSLNNLFNATTQATQFYGNEIIKLQEQRAQAATRTALLDYQAAQQKFLQELSTSNDFGNWEAKADNFLTEQNNKLQANAASPLTAKYLQQAMEQNRAGLMLKVNEYAFNGIQKDIKAYNERSLATMRDQLSGKEGQETSTALLDDMLINGQIEQAECDQERRKNAMHFAGKEMNELAGAIVSNAVQNGKSLEEIKATISEACTNLTEVDNEEYYGSEAKSSCISGALKYAEAKYENDLKALQSRNANWLTQNFVSAIDHEVKGSINEKYIKENGMRSLDYMMKSNPLSLDKSQYEHYLAKFRPDKEKDEDTGSGRTGGSKKLNFDMEIESLFNNVRNGDITAQNAFKYLNNAYADTIRSQNPDISNDNFRDALLEANFSLMDKVTKLVTNKLSGQELTEVNNAWSKLSDRVKSIAQENKMEYNGLVSSFASYFADQIGEVFLTRPESISAVVKELDRQVDNWQVSALYQRKEGKEGDTLFMQKYINKKGEFNGDVDKMFFDGSEELSGAKVAFSDLAGNEHYINPNSIQSVNLIDKGGRSVISALTGKDVSEIYAQWESDGGTDYTGRREYIVDGDVFTVGKDGKKNVIYKNGKTYATEKDVKAKRKEIEANFKKNLEEIKSEARKEVKTSYNRRIENDNNSYEDLVQTVSGMPTDPANKILKSQWDLMSVTEKIDHLKSENILSQYYSR